jgi:thiol-disulfide isomerase/thioredoxin
MAILGILFAGMVFSSEVRAIPPGEKAPELSLPTLEGGEVVTLESFKGKVVYVDFWASWCPPCRRSLPLYEELQKRLGTGHFQILAVNLDEDVQDAERFLQRHPVSYPVLYDPTGDSAQRWTVLAMPSSYLVDSNGKLANIYIGFEPSHIGMIENDIKALMDRMPAAQSD